MDEWDDLVEDGAVAYVAQQVAVPATDLAFYGWEGRTVHVQEIRGQGCCVGGEEDQAAWSMRSG